MSPPRGRAWQTALLGLALLILGPVGYYLWQMRVTATPQSAAAAAPAAAVPGGDASALKVSLPALAQVSKPADAGPVAPVKTAVENSAPAGGADAEAAPANPAAARRQAGPSPKPLVTDLDFFLDAKSVQGAGGADVRAPGLASQTAAPANLVASPPAPANREAPSHEPHEPATAADTPRTNPDERAARVEPEPDVQRFRLTSLIIGHKAPAALINGRVVSVGDVVDGAKVVAIAAQGVDLEIDGRRVTLRM